MAAANAKTPFPTSFLFHVKQHALPPFIAPDRFT
jgi:hypothetical protein